MRKQFIYFFKHSNTTGIKIGRTSGDSVNDRFKAFKTYSPSGSEIIGFFECDNCVALERKIHIELKANRMQGEFFDITEDHALAIINKYDVSLRKIKYIFNEWLSNEENNTDALLLLFKKANEVKKLDGLEALEMEHIKIYFKHGNVFKTTSQILKHLQQLNPNVNYVINKLGSALRELEFKRIKSGGSYGYLIDFKL